MRNETIKPGAEASVEWEHLEAWVRGKVQEFIQGILEEEVTEFLGRRKSERRSHQAAPLWIPQRVWPAPEADPERGDDRGATPPGAQRRGAV